ncbi:helix-turn-helix transcriptional regulator [Streptomyces sp. NBC_01255]|uniref:helix-turn-helix transcriptional regulator n=1 Tax=Streptomyces sp. NBC_01255 TaxID=2903798 RepID=UPI002E2FE345|nr:helix-turn-helix transcriptional regulator [Streptomyces sp. NBC_01255]
MPLPAAHARSRERVLRICAAGGADGDAHTLRVRLLREFRALLGAEAFAFLLTDPVTSVGCAPVARVPVLPELPRLIRLKYLTRADRWTSLKGAAALSGLPEVERGPLWEELLRPAGVRDVASAVFRDRFGCWGFLDLWRYGAEFGAADLAYLDAVAAPVTEALRRAQAAGFPARPPGAAGPGPLVLLLSPDLRVRGQTPEAPAYLAGLIPPEEGRAPVPAAAYNVAAQLLAREAGVDPNPPRARVHLADGLWLTLRAARIDHGSRVTGAGAGVPGAGGSGAGVPGAGVPGAEGSTPLDREIAVTIEETTPTDRLDVFCRAHGLTARETELLGHLADGADTGTAAHAMSLSAHTVQDHLKSVFTKTGTRHRRGLLARALGT